MVELNDIQQAVLKAEGRTLLLGRAGTGKSTALLHRLRHLLKNGEPAYTILVLVSDFTQRQQLLSAVREHHHGALSDLNVMVYNILAKDMVSLFWPLIATEAGFSAAYKPPTFLDYDLAQLLMWRTIQPLLEAGDFKELRLRPQQIVSQMLDTLNRAALNDLSIEAAAQRQMQAWADDPEHIKYLESAKEAALTFRTFCLEKNLLDLSLTIDTFHRFILGHPEFSRYFGQRYRHFLVDNVEEQPPVGRIFVEHLIDLTETTTIAFDEDGGYHWLMAADPKGAGRLQSRVDQRFEFKQSFSSSAELLTLANHLSDTFLQRLDEDNVLTHSPAIKQAITGRYRREMVFGTVRYLAELIAEEGVAPKDIAIITPYLDGALRFTLEKAMMEYGLTMNLRRRRAGPRDDPRVRTWLTWLALANPAWGIEVVAFDVAEALSISIAGLDPARAALVAEALFEPQPSRLKPVDYLDSTLIERIGVAELALVEQLRLWLLENHDQFRLDIFLYRLFSDLLMTPAFQPAPDVAAAAVCQWLVRTATGLCDAAETIGLKDSAEIGTALFTAINQGLVTSRPPAGGDPPDPDGIHVSTIHGYLLHADPVQYIVFLDASTSGWWDIPRQPLSNAFVLNDSWEPDRVWTMSDEFHIRNLGLSRIIHGLLARCAKGIIITHSDLDRRGQRQNGLLWRTMRPLFQPPAD